MSSMLHLLIFAAGLVLLYFGAESLLRGAVRLAQSFGISPFLIGLTLVGFGTSAPELTVNLSAAFDGKTDLALGNVVGSNIANIGLILGISALISPLLVQMRLLRVEVPIVIGVSLLLWLLAADGIIDRRDGLVLMAGFAAMTFLVYWTARRESTAVKQEVAELAETQPRSFWDLLLVVGGLAGLVVGAELMVHAAVALAKELGISELIIGLTIVAVGTSLPELASSAVASWRGHADIAVGNIIGSNIFNILLIIGITASILPLPVDPPLLSRWLPVMLILTVALLPILWQGLLISRLEGGLLCVTYAGFIGWQVWQATGN